jgi:transcriptional regulator with XRE-family HTH domain
MINLSNLRAARLAAGMTQQELSVAIGLSVRMISGIETGKVTKLSYVDHLRGVEKYLKKHLPQSSK